MSVRYTVSAAPKFGTITGAGQVTDADLDLVLGSLQDLVQKTFGAQAVFANVESLQLGSVTVTVGENDSLLVREGDVLLWVSSPNTASARLHASTTTASTASHPFMFRVIAEGTESPAVTFDYTIRATGKERFPKTVQEQKAIKIPYARARDDLSCRELSNYVCLDADCTLSSTEIKAGDASPDSQFTVSAEGVCAKYFVQCSGTNFWKENECRGFDTGCNWCGSWLNATVTATGTCPRPRTWTRTAKGIGTARNAIPAQGNAAIVFQTDYATAGGILGSGLADTISVEEPVTYSGEVSGCTAGGAPVACSVLQVTNLGSSMRVATDYRRPVALVNTANATLDSTQGIRSFGTFPFAPQNGDPRYSLEVTFQGITYRNVNTDPVVDVGPFSLWIGGATGYELFGAFDRSAVPSAFIDSILPNPALAGETVTFTGHGTGAFTGYQWSTHRVDQPTPFPATPTVMRKDLVVGKHQISFRVIGAHLSPIVTAQLTVNQPPVAFINRVTNVNDLKNPSTALLLRDGIPSDPFLFDGGGIDFDGSISAVEWSIGNVATETKRTFQMSLPLGTHTISLRVRDNLGVWSSPTMTTVLVRRPPVLLVHGICGDTSTWQSLLGSYASGTGLLGPDWQKSDLVNRKFDPNGDGVTNDSPKDIAAMVAAEIEKMKAQFGVRTVNLVVHSMGGLASRIYIQGPAYRGDVNKLVMLGTPNHGASIADFVLITNHYSMEDVELYVPAGNLQAFIHLFGLFVDLFGNVFGADVCLAQDSPAFHGLRPHGTLVRNLNQTLKDEGTEDHGKTQNPADAISRHVPYFLIHGSGSTLSHTHLPEFQKTLIYDASLGQIDLDHMALVSVRDGDLATTHNSLALDTVTRTGFDRTHAELTDSKDSMNQVRLYLLDDPPPPPAPEAGPDDVTAAQLLAAFGGTEVPSDEKTIAVDAAASRLRVALSWSEGNADSPSFPAAPRFRITLTSPSGVVFDTSAPVSGFTSTVEGTRLYATLENPEPGSWQLQVVGTSSGQRYSVLAYHESRTFLAVGLSSHQKEPGEKVQIAAILRNGATAVTGATVYAAVAPPAGATLSVPMVEEPKIAGVYIGEYTPVVEGTFKVVAGADITMPGGAVVTRTGMATFDARLRAALSVEIRASALIAKHGDPLRLTAVVRNAGKADATAIPVQFFDGLPEEGGRLLATRTVDVPSGREVQTSILWRATTGGHHLVVVVDPMNLTEAADQTKHLSGALAVIVDDQPPIARAGPDQIAAVGQPIVLDGRASTDDDRIVTYEWRVPTLARPVPFEGAYVSIGGGLPGPDVHSVVLTVTDASGNVHSDTLEVRVIAAIDTTRPVANAGTEINATVGAPVAFDGTRSRDDFGIAYATWDVDLTRDSDGDGDRGNDHDLAGLAPTFLRGYSRIGRFRARLTVRDAAGNGPVSATVIVNVTEPSTACTVVVPPGGDDVQRFLAAARSGETICLESALYRTSGLTMTTPGVILDGQGAILEYVAPLVPPEDFHGIGVSVTTAEDTEGVTVRRVNFRGFNAGILALGDRHRFVANSVEGGIAGIGVVSRTAHVERNRVSGAFYGYVIDGADHRVVNNTANTGTSGFVVTGSGHVLEGNDACGNSLVDFHLIGTASGRVNACGRSTGWSDASGSGCTFRCDEIRGLVSGQVVDRNTFIPGGTFELDEGVVVTGTAVQLHFAGTELVGPEGVEIPAIEVRDATGAAVSGASIAGFTRGVRVTRGSAVELIDLSIADAEVGVEAVGARNGLLRDVRVSGATHGLRLDDATRDWTVTASTLAGDVDLAGSGHLLRENRIEGQVAVLAGATGSRLRGNTIFSKNVGISVDSAGAAEIAGNTIHADSAAIRVRGSSRSTIRGNSVIGHRGIVVDGGEGHTLLDNRIEAFGAAVHLSGTRRVEVERNVASVPNGPGIVLSLAAGTRITGNDLRQSRLGLDLQSSHLNRIAGNVFAAGMTPDITLSGSHANTIFGNTLSDIWPGGVLALASSRNRITANTLRPSGATPREVTALGISLAGRLRKSPSLPLADVERILGRAWESLRPFASRNRLRVATGGRFFEGLASALGGLRDLGRTARASDEDRDLIRAATEQMTRGAGLVARQAIDEARALGADPAAIAESERRWREAKFFEATGRPDLAVASFGRAWTVVGPTAASPARLSATMSVAGSFAEGEEVVYTVIITNAGPRTQRDNPGDEFFDRLPPDVEVIDVLASSGRASADRATNGVNWNGSVAPGASIRLTIRARIKTGTARRTITNQGALRFDGEGDGVNDAGALTDDPTIAGPADPTAFIVKGSQSEPEPHAIPLSPEALAILTLLLATVALSRCAR